MTEPQEISRIQREDILGYLASANAEKLDWLLGDLTAALRIKIDIETLTAGEWASAKQAMLSNHTVRTLIVCLEAIPKAKGFTGGSTTGNAINHLASMVGFTRQRNQFTPGR